MLYCTRTVYYPQLRRGQDIASTGIKHCFLGFEEFTYTNQTLHACTKSSISRIIECSTSVSWGRRAPALPVRRQRLPLAPSGPDQDRDQVAVALRRRPEGAHVRPRVRRDHKVPRANAQLPAGEDVGEEEERLDNEKVRLYLLFCKTFT